MDGQPKWDPVGTAVVAISFALLLVWFTWYLLSPPGLRVRPELRAEPIPRDFAVSDVPRRSFPVPRPGAPYPALPGSPPGAGVPSPGGPGIASPPGSVPPSPAPSPTPQAP